MDTGSVTTVIGAETFGTDDETVMGGDITTGEVTGGEVRISGTVEARDFVEGSLPYLVIDQTILNFHTIHQTFHISQSSHPALCPAAVCTVLRVHCTTWCTVRFTLLCSLRCAGCNGGCCDTIANS